MKEMIEKLLHVPVTICKKEGKLGLPFYLTTGRDLYDVQVMDTSFCAVAMEETENTDIRKLKHQITQYCTAFGKPVAYYIPDMTGRKREALIKSGVPFIAPPGQIYLPFLGMVLQDRYLKIIDAESKRMSPLEQQLLLWLLYNKKECSKSDLADSLNVTRAAISKVAGALFAKGLITERKDGKNVYIMIAGSAKDCYQRARGWMINPIKRTACCLNADACERFPLAGESALSERSMLSPPPTPIRACYEKDIRLNEMKLIDDEKWIEGKDYVKLEIWKYDPRFECDGKTVDLISLALSLEGINDERIDGELQTIMEAAGWQ